MKSFPIFTFSAMVDHIILTTFRNNTLQKGNSPGYDLQVHLRYRNSSWNKETEINIVNA